MREIGFILTAIFGVTTLSAPLQKASVPVKVAAVVPVGRTFDAAWNDVEAGRKADKIRVIPLTVPPKTVVTERIISIPVVDAPPVSAPSVAVPLEEDKPVVLRRRRVVSDVCTRHGLRKVQYGKRWRCRR